MTAPLATPALRAVVVDDTPDLRELLCLALQTTGEFVVVGEAGNGMEGIARVRQHEPDIVLLDLAMPVMDGLEALPQIREICPEATIIVLSGFGASAMAQKALAAGADGYLEKGAPVATILDYVRSLVGRTSPPGLRVLPSPEPERARRPAPSSALDVAFDLAPDGVLVLANEPPLTVVAANPRAVELLGVREPTGKVLADIDPDLAALVRRISTSADGVDETRLGSPPRTIRVVLRHAADKVVVYLHPQEDPGDVEMLRRAIATTAHEIRTPVTVLVGVADTLRDRGDDITPDLRARLGAAVVRQARLLDNMTSDLLTAAQAHRGTLHVALERVDVKAVLGSVLDGPYSETVIEGTVTAKVLADPFRLEQMITNLLGNAVKYGAPPYVVRVSTTDDEVLLHVVDHGDGVPAEFVPALFDEFTRAKGTSARGTGLGLYVVASLAAAQSGTVSYGRSADTSVFTIALPRADF